MRPPVALLRRLEVTIRRLCEGEDFSFTQKANPLPGRDLTDLGQRPTGMCCGGAKTVELGRRQREKDLVIIAADAYARRVSARALRGCGSR